YRPFRIFVCADLQARLDRCMAYERKRPRSVRLTEKEILRNIRQIDKSRSRTREILTGKRHGDSSMFDLTLNASGWEIKRLAFAAADYAARWFEMQDETAEAGMDKADAAADGMDAT
ncbi:MAG: cytidylate kinase family protein, partial [Oscillospiraceae bacterium]|nr:cytidylate kinase family protein [Oscillospiraceae bacterium]